MTNHFKSEKETPLIGYRHFLQGDISGIQEFIFNTKSEGAAKTLKARSYFVQALSDLCLHLIEETLGTDKCMLFYNGGGNFYVFCKELSDSDLKDLRKKVQEHLQRHEIYLNLSKTDLFPDEFARTWKAIHAQSNEDKLRKFFEYSDGLDHPERYRADQDEQRNFWKLFSTEFVKEHAEFGFSINLPPDIGKFPVQKDGFTIFERMLTLDKKKTQYKDSIVNKLPQWTQRLLDEPELQDIIAYLNEREVNDDLQKDYIIDFEALGRFAALRTGTDKIAALKMDVDNLGKFFKEAESWDDAFNKSSALKEFFDKKMLYLWREGKFGTHPYNENLYIVFSGGDDCMVIGAWDAVFQFAGLVRKEFKTFVENNNFSVTLSAGIVMVDSKYPIVRMADLAEEAIKSAKYHDPKEKNQIAIFNRVMRWIDFEKATSFAEELAKIIKDGESRSFLHRFQNTHLSFEKMHNEALDKGTIRNPEIWRLEYYLARRKEENAAKDLLKDLIKQYQIILLDAITRKQPTDLANLYPVAARWAEFLTRNTD